MSHGLDAQPRRLHHLRRHALHREPSRCCRHPTSPLPSPPFTALDKHARTCIGNRRMKSERREAKAEEENKEKTKKWKITHALQQGKKSHTFSRLHVHFRFDLQFKPSREFFQRQTHKDHQQNKFRSHLVNPAGVARMIFKHPCAQLFSTSRYTKPQTRKESFARAACTASLLIKYKTDTHKKLQTRLESFSFTYVLPKQKNECQKGAADTQFPHPLSLLSFSLALRSFLFLLFLLCCSRSRGGKKS